MLEAYEQTAEVVAVLINAVVQLFYRRLLQVAQHFLLQLSAAFSGNDLQHFDPPVNAELHRFIQRAIDLLALVEDIVQIELVFGHCACKVAGFIRASHLQCGSRIAMDRQWRKYLMERRIVRSLQHLLGARYRSHLNNCEIFTTRSRMNKGVLQLLLYNK